MLYLLMSLIIFAWSIYFLVLYSKWSGNLLSGGIEDRWSGTRKVPMVGGIALWTGSLFAFLFLVDKGNILPAKLLTVFVYISFIFLFGVKDDLFTTQAKVKFFEQLLFSLVITLILFDFKFGWSFLFSIILIGIINSINMIDNMDGTCTAAVIPIFGSMHFLFPHFGLLLTYFAWALSIFFFLNMRGKVFLGDSGSNMIGAFLGIMACCYLYNNFSLINCFGVFLLFGANFTDTIYVVLKRMKKGRPFWIGGKDHLTHFIFEKQKSKLQTSMAVFGFSLVCNIFGLQLLGRI